MRVAYINPFINSAVLILSEMVTHGEKIEKKQLTLATKTNEIFDVAMIVGLAGQVTGRVIINMDKDTALKIASEMNDEKFSELDELARSALTELTNIIVGKAVTELHDMGYQFDICPPILITGKKMTINDLSLESIIVPLVLPQGTIEINVAVKELA